MKLKKSFIILVLSLTCYVAGAQNSFWLLDGLKSFAKFTGIKALYEYAHTRDTSFYEAPPGVFCVRLSENMMGTYIGTRGSELGEQNRNFRTKIKSANMWNNTITVGAYGLAVGFTFNPFANSKNNDTRFTLTLNGNFLGLDVGYYKINSLSGYSRLNSQRHEIAYGDPSMKFFMINAYGVLNHKHYSYPAGVGQAYIQKKSSGSLLLSANFDRVHTSVPDRGFDEPDISINSSIISVGVGYGYNYVPAKDWLVSFTVIPRFVVYNSSYLDVDKYHMSETFKRPSITYSGNFAVVRRIGNVFLAITAVADGYQSYHYASRFSFDQTQWHMHAHVGINF